MIGNEPHYQHQSPTQCSQDHLHFSHSCNKLRKAEGHLIKTWWCLLLVVAAMSFTSKLDSDASPLKLLNHLRTCSYMYSRTPRVFYNNVLKLSWSIMANIESKPLSFLLLLQLLLLPFYVHAKSGVTSIIVFGDSSVDTGNNNHISTIAKSDFEPYGRDFDGGQATGRFCNGRVATDFISEDFGLKPAVPAYLDPAYKISDFVNGVCFASAATGYDNATSDVLVRLFKLCTWYLFWAHLWVLLFQCNKKKKKNIIFGWFPVWLTLTFLYLAWTCIWGN